MLFIIELSWWRNVFLFLFIYICSSRCHHLQGPPKIRCQDLEIPTLKNSVLSQVMIPTTCDSDGNMCEMLYYTYNPSRQK